MKNTMMLLMGVAVLCMGGCGTTYYQPNALPVEGVMAFSAKGSIALINGQPSTEPIPFVQGQHANLNAWTDIAISMAERELSQRGLAVSKDATKSLTMWITSAKTDIGLVMFNTQIVMNARTSGGYTATYTGRDKSAMFGNPGRQMDTALARVVAEMLNDPKIVSFLSDGRGLAEEPKQDAPVQKTDDIYTELRKLKKLLDDGIITQAEFDAKKKKILGD